MWLVDFEPSTGSEPAKVRPAVVVSNNGSNTAVAERGRGTVVVVPLTSNLSRVRPYQALVRGAESGLDRDSKAQAELVRAVDWSKLVRQVGAELPTESMAGISEALRVHLSL